MSTAIPFDTLAFAKELEGAGVPSGQAEAQAKALSGVLQKVEESRLHELATKGDILRLEKDIESAKVATIQWTAGMFAAQTAMIIGAVFAMLKMNQPSLQPTGYHTPPVQEMRLPAPPVPALSAPTTTTPVQPIPTPPPASLSR
ncbi:MAG: DUF1640 domain-containing protein [Magnetococcales bacterium]|nr:DUF1640 domain-containing protein [Magnetococcales bacterium]